MRKFVCLLALVFLLSACGNEKSESTAESTPAPPPTEKMSDQMNKAADAASEKVQQATEQVKQATEQAVDKAQQVSAAAAEQVTEKAQQMQTEASDMVQQASTKMAAMTASDKGKTVYQSSCASCHTSGILGAPKLDDPKLTGNLDTLVKNAINGIGQMPPKGGNSSLSAADVKAAVEYMVQQSQ